VVRAKEEKAFEGGGIEKTRTVGGRVEGPRSAKEREPTGKGGKGWVSEGEKKSPQPRHQILGPPAREEKGGEGRGIAIGRMKKRVLG